MASNYWTESRIRITRVQAGFVRCNDIVKEYVEIKLSEKYSVSRDEFLMTWRRWCHENIDHIKRYRFWRNQAKEEDEGREMKLVQYTGSFTQTATKEIDIAQLLEMIKQI